jgi:oxygen-independent coproporphyrinogen-3 oxidase
MARALYIHWPFCARKCPYCDFNSHVREHVDIDAFRRAFMAELAYEHALADSGPLRSIFFGGGTPSLMPTALVGELLAEAERRWGFDPGIEITLEANPSSVEAANFAALADAGINRVSLGLQSLDDAALRFLGRLHGADEGLAALDVAQRHFARVSFDLIYALPGQKAGDWEVQLSRALSFGTGHLSLYQLTIEPGTRFATDVRRRTFAPLEDDPAAELYTLTQDLAGAAGIPAYEISNHARPGEESRHNLTYWRYEDYLGIGAGAHGRRGGSATLRHKKPENWLAACATARHGLCDEVQLTPQDQVAEALLMGLRLTEGIDPAAIASRFGLGTDQLLDAARVAFHEANGLLWRSGERLGVTAAGMPLLDALLGEIVAGELVRA